MPAHEDGLRSGTEAEAQPLLLGLLALLLGAAPWVRRSGLTPGWTGAACVLAALLLARFAARPQTLEPAGRRLRRIGACGALVLVLCALQLIPLGGLLAWVSPQSGALRSGLWDDSLGCVALYPFHARAAALGWAVAAVVFMTCARGLRAQSAGRLLTLLLLVGVAQIATAAFLQGGRLHSVRASGSYVNANHFAGLLALLTPLALYRGGVGVERRRAQGGSQALAWGWIAVAGLLLLGVALSRSRSGLLAAFVGCLAYLWTGTSSRKRGWLAACLLGVALWAGWEGLVQRFSGAFQEQILTRPRVWWSALEASWGFPLFGSGPRCFAEVSPRFWQGPELVTSPHNEFLGVLTGVGLVGGVLVFLALWTYVLAVRERLALLPPGRRRSCVRACAAGLFGLALACVFEFNLEIRSTLWIAAAVAGLALARSSTAPSAAEHSSSSRLPQLVLVASAAVLAWQGARLAQGAFCHGRAAVATSSLDVRRAWFERAARATPESAEVFADWGRLEIHAGDYPAAVRTFSWACLRRPTNPSYHVQLAEALLGAGDEEAGVAALQRAHELGPHFAWIQLPLAKLWAWHLERDPPDVPGARAQVVRACGAALAANPALSADVSEVLLRLHKLTSDEALAVFPAELPDERRRFVARLVEVQGEDAGRVGRALLAPLLEAPNAADLKLAGELELWCFRNPSRARERWKHGLRLSDQPGAFLRSVCAQLQRKGLGLSWERRVCEDARALVPKDAEVAEQLGRVLLELGDLRAAEKELELAQSLDPRRGGVWLGRLYLQRGMPSAAIRVWEQTLERQPAVRVRLRLHAALARLYEARGETSRAIEHRQAAARLIPKEE